MVVSSANMELELVRQCLDRALVLDERVSKFSVQLGEWPGDMAKLLDFLSREDVRSATFCPTHAWRRLAAAIVSPASVLLLLPGCWTSATGHRATGQTSSRQR